MFRPFFNVQNSLEDSQDPETRILRRGEEIVQGVDKLRRSDQSTVEIIETECQENLAGEPGWMGQQILEKLVTASWAQLAPVGEVLRSRRGVAGRRALHFLR